VSHDPETDEMETDPRFPSGPWVGFYVQKLPPVGKQWMELRLTFRSGTMTGEGRDVVGRFTVAGHYEVADGRCQWKKSYEGRHDVFYSGFNEGKGIWGSWEIRNMPIPGDALHGGFHIWPDGMSDPSGSTLQAELDLPVEEDVEATPLAAPAIRTRVTMLDARWLKRITNPIHAVRLRST
jgi:hypothetical protein